MTTRTFPARFVRDWINLSDGEFINTCADDAVEVVSEDRRRITVRLGPDALCDLVERARCYAEETYDEPYLRALQASARATLQVLAETG